MDTLGHKLAVGIVSVLIIFSAVVEASDKVDPADLVTKHLDSIGNASARTANTLRTGAGTAVLDVISGGMGHMEGTSQVASMGKQFNFIMYFNASDYIGEQFKFDGKKALVADNNLDRRVNLAFFMYRHDTILKEGLWGGVWNSGWPLQDLKGREAELKYEGTKKIDGKQLLVYLYVPRHAEKELRIRLLFDPETFRHVRTIYDAMGPIGDLPAVSVTEAFSDFRDEKGLMLPHSWVVRFEPGQAGSSFFVWKVNLKDVKVVAVSAPAAAQPAPGAQKAPNAQPTPGAQANPSAQPASNAQPVPSSQAMPSSPATPKK